MSGCTKNVCPECGCRRWRGVGSITAHCSDAGCEEVMKIIECMRCGEVWDCIHVDNAKVTHRVPTNKPMNTPKTYDGTLLKPTNLFGSWVAIEDRQPEESGYYLCACEGGNVDKSFWNPSANLDELKIGRKYAGKWGRFFELAKKGYRITHWMPMPPPPNAEHSDESSEA